METDRIAPPRAFVQQMTRLVETTQEEAELMRAARPLLALLIADDSWLPEACARTHPEFYQQYLLHCDPLERFSVVCLVWGPGQRTPVHDHGVWGLIGVLRGAERCQRYRIADDGSLQADGDEQRSNPGDIEAVSPILGDIHRVANAFDDAASISIHLYGANIGAIARHVFDPVSVAPKSFVSGYSSAHVPTFGTARQAIRGAVAG